MSDRATAEQGWLSASCTTQLDNHPAYALAAKLGERLQSTEEGA